jgi:hypothetical protein
MGSLSLNGGRAKLAENSAPLPLIKSYRMRPILAWSISLDRTFNKKNHPQMELAKQCLRV